MSKPIVTKNLKVVGHCVKVCNRGSPILEIVDYKPSSPLSNLTSTPSKLTLLSIFSLLGSEVKLMSAFHFYKVFDIRRFTKF